MQIRLCIKKIAISTDKYKAPSIVRIDKINLVLYEVMEFMFGWRRLFWRRLPPSPLHFPPQLGGLSLSLWSARV